MSAIVTYSGDGGYIPDNCYPTSCQLPSENEFNSSILVAEDFIISDIIFTLDWAHSASTDILTFELSGPSGLASITGSQPCMENGVYTFTDNATATQPVYNDTDCSFGKLASGEYMPFDSFAASFVGKSSFGQWNLSIFDGFSLDEGVVNSWQLTLISVPAPASSIFIVISLGMIFVPRKTILHFKG
jgi:subtilisin-like proprotein convertase family protein